METRNTIRMSRTNVQISVSAFLFREGDTYIAYCPSLDISGYEHTEEKAKAELEYMLREWLVEQMENGTLRKDLEKHGWELGARVAKEPKVEALLGRKTPAGPILARPEFRKTNVFTGVRTNEYV